MQFKAFPIEMRLRNATTSRVTVIVNFSGLLIVISIYGTWPLGASNANEYYEIYV